MYVTKSKIIVCCSQSVTGGPEVLHQLVNELCKQGHNAVIAYYPFEEYFECPIQYKRYNIKQGQLVDDSDTFIIIPESATWIIKRIKYAQIGIWWLSVDNYLFARHQSKINDVYFRYKSLIRWRLPLYRLKEYLHFTQSHYGANFLKSSRINSIPLSDYLSDEHLILRFTDDCREKENIVAYNPMKGKIQTKLIIKAYPDIQFIPINNMTALQVVELLSRAKIYIDFGHHPGKDRLPREAAMARCCVISGNKGSARFHEDLPIPKKYKLGDENNSYVYAFGQLAKAIFSDFNIHVIDFEYYREQILAEHENFKKQVKAIFC